MNKRLFTFGCSFTQYCWPTWADILGQEFDHYENWGMCGGGNQFIFNSLIECNLRNTLTPEDTVIIMWTNIYRLDFYTDHWIGSGNLLSPLTGAREHKKFLLEHTNDRGLLIRDAAIIDAAYRILNSTGCTFQFHSMVPIIQTSQFTDTLAENIDDVLSLYQSSLKSIKANVYDLIYNGDWSSIPGPDITYSLTFPVVQQEKKLKQRYNNVKGATWPTYDDFINGVVNPSLLQEISQFGLIDEYKLIKKSRDSVKLIYKKNLSSYLNLFSTTKDFHPSPTTHLDYIIQAMPEFTVSAKTIEWVQDIDRQILNNTYVDFDQNLPSRL